MKKYRLVKKYPSLPSDWEEGMEVVTGERTTPTSFSPCNGKYVDYYIPYAKVAHNPKFWEEVIEKDYEILSFTNRFQIFRKCIDNIFKESHESNDWRTEEWILNHATLCKIHSVRRLSDNAVFVLGESVVFLADKPYLNHCSKIGSFELRDGTIMVKNEGCLMSSLKNIKKDDGKKDYELIRYIDEKGNGYKDGKSTFSIKGDGKVHVFEVKRLSDNVILKIGDRVTENVTGSCKGWTIKEFSLKDTRCFSAGVNINNITKREVLLTTEDGVDIHKHDSFYFVCTEDGLGFEPYVFLPQRWKTPVDNKAFKYFYTKEGVEEFILLNKPCLSLNDVFKVYPKLKKKEPFVNTHHADQLIAIVKKKL